MKKDFELYLDDDGYVCFIQQDNDGTNVLWTLHYGGWEAYLPPSADEACYETGEHDFPFDRDLEAVSELMDEWKKENK